MMTREQVEDRDRELATKIVEACWADDAESPIELFAAAITAARAEERKRAEGLVEALRFYANRDNWHFQFGKSPKVLDNADNARIGECVIGGKRARESLAAYSASDVE